MGSGYSKTSSNPDFTVELALTCALPIQNIVSIAETAGEAILAIYDSEASKWQVEEKSDHSPLTRADREANRIITEELTHMSPHIPIVSEENSIPSHEIRKKYQYFWLVDPLDGTKEFLKRNGEFTVNIALVANGVPVIGVVHVPCQSKTYWAIKGKGAWLQTPRNQVPFQAAEFSLDDPGLRIVGSSSHLSKETEEFVALFESPEFVQVGSSLKMLMVAEGIAHMYPRLAPTSEWDTAAADVIVVEAGGVVLQAGNCSSDGKPLEDWKKVLVQEKPLVYNKENLLNPFFVVFGRRRNVGGGSVAGGGALLDGEE